MWSELLASGFSLLTTGNKCELYYFIWVGFHPLLKPWLNNAMKKAYTGEKCSFGDAYIANNLIKSNETRLHWSSVYMYSVIPRLECLLRWCLACAKHTYSKRRCIHTFWYSYWSQETGMCMHRLCVRVNLTPLQKMAVAGLVYTLFGYRRFCIACTLITPYCNHYQTTPTVLCKTGPVLA